MAEAKAINHQTSIGVVIKVGAIELANVAEIPDLLAAPEKLDVTSIGSDKKQYTTGLADPGDLEFTLWYDKDVYTSLNALEGEQTIQVIFEDKSGVEIKGEVSLGISGFSAGDAIQFVMSVAATSVERKEAFTA